MGCVVLKSVHGGDHFAFRLDTDRDDITIPTDPDDCYQWDELHELAEEWAISACAFDRGDEYVIGVTDENDAGAARMTYTKVLWHAGYYTIPDDDDDDDDE